MTKQSPAKPFNDWRKTYDSKSYEEHVAFHEKWSKIYPDQNRYNIERIRVFFYLVAHLKRSIGVLEIGGWKGQLAKQMLKEFPSIKRWHNVEISKVVADETACHSKRYIAEVLPDFFWKATFDARLYDVLILSHVIEHMKGENLKGILEKTPSIKYLYIAAPIEQKTEDVDWKGFVGTHILEIGWEDVHRLIRGCGFEAIENACSNSIKIYYRMRNIGG